MSLFPADVKTFNPRTERAVMGPDGPGIIPIPEELVNLRKLRYEDRMNLGRFLAFQGFPVDVQIDIWGWDPVKTMRLRAGYGYTWVNAFIPVSVAPGLSVPSLPPYDPNHAPVGSILVPPKELLP